MRKIGRSQLTCSSISLSSREIAKESSGHKLMQISILEGGQERKGVKKR